MESTIIDSIINHVGFNGPMINFAITFVLLFYQKTYLYGFLLCYLVNALVNKFLKGIFKQPRPTDGKSVYAIEDYSGVERYGMPSGHAQTVSFIITYMYLVKKRSVWLMIEIGIAGITMYQRFSSNRHTVEQLSVGFAVGMIVGIASFYSVKYIIQQQSFS
jgi:membrane-associated phospholipid phosphatase